MNNVSLYIELDTLEIYMNVYDILPEMSWERIQVWQKKGSFNFTNLISIDARVK